jgi:hypothetical protein
MEETLDDDPQMEVIPGLVCKRDRSHPIRKRDEKPDKPGEFMRNCSSCRLLSAQNSKLYRSKPRVPKPAKNVPEELMDENDPLMETIPGRMCLDNKLYPIRKRDAKKGRPGVQVILHPLPSDKDGGECKAKEREGNETPGQQNHVREVGAAPSHRDSTFTLSRTIRRSAQGYSWFPTQLGHRWSRIDVPAIGKYVHNYNECAKALPLRPR